MAQWLDNELPQLLQQQPDIYPALAGLGLMTVQFGVPDELDPERFMEMFCAHVQPHAITPQQLIDLVAGDTLMEVVKQPPDDGYQDMHRITLAAVAHSPDIIGEYWDWLRVAAAAIWHLN
jgi:hypothetical protein